MYIFFSSISSLLPTRFPPPSRRCAWSCVPMTAARQAPLSMDFPGKNTGVGCHCLLHKGIFLAYNQPLSFPLMPRWQAQAQVGVG